jgi:hypothetical protein
MSSKRSGTAAVLSPPEGAQEPRLRSVPDYVSSAGDEAIELCALAGLELDLWQQLVLTDMLGERADGKWACYRFGLVVPRQNGKGSCLEARELAGLFLLGEKLIIHSAHEQATSSEHFRRVLNLIEGVPEFDQRVLKAVRGKGQEGIELRGGQRIFFKTRTQDGGRGLTGDFVALDEAMKLREATMAALGPTMAARSILGNPQLVYAGSAVDGERDEHGIVLTRLREEALSGSNPRLGYHEFSCEGDDPSSVPEEVAGDPEAWGHANPGLGIRISSEYIADERGTLDARSFAVERLGIGDWPDLSEEAGRVIPSEAWNPLADPGSAIAKAQTFSISIEPGQAWATISEAGQRDDGLWDVRVVEHARGTSWILDSAKEWSRQIPVAEWVADPRSDWGNLLTELDEAGIQVKRMSAADYKDACGGFFQAVIDRQLRYQPPQPELDAAVAGVKTRPLLDAWKWDWGSGVTITPLVSCTNALWGARTQGTPEVWDLNEVAERLRREQAGEPEKPQAQTGGQRFIPLDQMPVHSGVFKP